MNKKTYSGFTEATAENLLLDAGVFFVNYEIDTDTFETAVTGGKLLGATRGGGNFTATPTIRKIEVDGVKGAAKGLQVIDEWVVNITANVLEVTKEALSKALTASEVDTSTNENYDIIKAKNYIELTDYIDNITWVGKLSGTAEPVIIQVLNAINTQGLTLQTQDKNEAVIAMTFTGHYDAAELDNPPFAIYYPKTIVNTVAPTSFSFSKAAPADAELTITSTAGAVATNVKLNSTSLGETDFTIGTGTVTISQAYLSTLTEGQHVFTIIMDKGNSINITVTVSA